ncbi:hypothetical protein BST36_30090 [Mycolicibacterium moriokaense]|uniref:Ferredoxin n=1 Tax=Mycolicibacterium moriokaense TaxID=39691 RepID=A0AAD1H690_9MYCO|nr:ferredoxin [Mycolicibacterium moriokaense]MCV7042510.1 ferredoxin [Mycolicibacterium moriokaense]ORB12325.1 hypothetical protein BST36_30090 [Mycolicibacterium moriokaense]BBW99188.1 hypothetical protein MMOR_01250 [Mycolicibacterium moriokaense]
MKRIAIDENLCQGSRVCAGIDESAVDFDGDGVALVVTVAVLADEVAERMESACPSMAITIMDSSSNPSA